MQIIIEGLGLAAFNVARQGTNDPVFKDMLYLIIRDEARHVTLELIIWKSSLKLYLKKSLMREQCLLMKLAL